MTAIAAGSWRGGEHHRVLKIFQNFRSNLLMAIQFCAGMDDAISNERTNGQIIPRHSFKGGLDDMDIVILMP